ncbi:MAG: ATP-binding cassette domain-containing protein, partial [Proteobacteria bacterium]|nr:ATP-binding cassette domain-containing protein [Pseudomonadota bacterium]
MTPLLELDRVSAGYGAAPVLTDLSLSLPAGGAMALLGRNGMGKTTAVRAVAGQTPWRTGSIRFDGRELADLPPHRLAPLGIAVVPEGRRIFPTLTVRENLTAFAPRRTKGPRWTPEQVWALFPELAARADAAGAHLS